MQDPVVRMAIANDNIYYAIADLDQEGADDQDEQIFTEKAAFTSAWKKCSKQARFKVFHDLESAQDFIRFSHQQVVGSGVLPAALSPQKSNGIIDSPDASSIQLLSPTRNNHSMPISSPESCAFKGPTRAELGTLRRVIERGDVDEYKRLVTSNPRYLISSGDTPVIIMEGPRYNSIHMAARNNQSAMCRAILSSIENRDLHSSLYPNTNDSSAITDRIQHLRDLYLNTPDKVACESPLHYACKHGYVDVVHVLVSYEETNKHAVNKWGQTPEQVTCTRSPGCNGGASLKARIIDLLDEQYYVCLYRSDATSTVYIAPPTTYIPAAHHKHHDDTPIRLSNMSTSTPQSPCINLPKSPHLFSPSHNHTPKRHSLLSTPTSPHTHTPVSPQVSSMTLHAYAGPTCLSTAQSLHSEWCSKRVDIGTLGLMAHEVRHIRRSDASKGDERIGRMLCHSLDVPWSEYWPFLSTHTETDDVTRVFTDLSSTHGLQLLDKHLRANFNNIIQTRLSSLDLDTTAGLLCGLSESLMQQLAMAGPRTPHHDNTTTSTSASDVDTSQPDVDTSQPHDVEQCDNDVNDLCSQMAALRADSPTVAHGVAHESSDCGPSPPHVPLTVKKSHVPKISDCDPANTVTYSDTSVKISCSKSTPAAHRHHLHQETRVLTNLDDSDSDCDYYYDIDYYRKGTEQLTNGDTDQTHATIEMREGAAPCTNERRVSDSSSSEGDGYFTPPSYTAQEIAEHLDQLDTCPPFFINGISMSKSDIDAARAITPDISHPPPINITLYYPCINKWLTTIKHCHIKATTAHQQQRHHSSSSDVMSMSHHYSSPISPHRSSDVGGLESGRSLLHLTSTPKRKDVPQQGGGQRCGEIDQ